MYLVRVGVYRPGSSHSQIIELGPLETIEFLVERRDSSGGSGANFLVQWTAETEVDRPLIEAVMVGTAGTLGISFREAGIDVSPVEGE